MVGPRIFFVAATLLACACESNPDVSFASPTPIETPTPPVPAGAPLDVVAVAGTGSISLTWTPPVTGDPATNYRVLVATTSFDFWETGLPGATATTTDCCAFTSTGLNDDQTYWLGVTAMNEAGEGPLSHVVSARPPGWTGYQLLEPEGGSLQVFSLAVSASSVFVGGQTTGTLDGVSAESAYDAYLSRYDLTGRRIWTRMHGAPGTSDAVFDATNGVAAGLDGSVVMVGTQDLGGSNTDYLLARYLEDGTPDFNFLRGTASNEHGRGIAIDADSDIYVAGQTFGDLDGETHIGLGDAFLVKSDSAGTRLWTTLINTAQADVGHAVAVRPDGTAYVAGETAGTLPSVIAPANSGIGIDGYVSKVDAAGAIQWTRQITSSGSDRARAVAVDDGGNVYVAGEAGGNLGGDTLQGTSDAFIGKYDPGGTLLWLNLLGSAGFDRGLGVTVGGDTLYVVGESATGLGGGNMDGFLAAYDLAGTLLWVDAISRDYADSATSVVIGNNSQLYVGGRFESESVSINDGFVGKFSTDGELQ